MFVFLLLGEVLDVFVTYVFFHQVELLALRNQSPVPLSFHVLPLVFMSILDTLNLLHHQNFVTLGGFLHSLIDGITCLSLIFSDFDSESLILTE